MPLKTICFDLDGTLTDPAPGITKSIEYACACMKIPSPPLTELLTFIGPPIQSTFANLLQTEDSGVIATAVAFYRERYSSIGMFECAVYPDIQELLSALQQSQRRIYLATSKPLVYARSILTHFELDSYFTGLYGSELDGTRTDKSELLAYLLSQEQLSPDSVVMIGDRKHDIIGAKKNGISSIGVTYGYGTANELAEAGADLLCHHPLALLESLQN